VRDTGEGLSAAKLGQLFQPFNRLGQEASGVTGTGIGLVVTKQLVELMEGRLGVESTVGNGSLFWVELQAALAPTLTADGVRSAHPYPASLAGSRRRTLLYVEDNPANMLLVEQLIERRADIHLVTAVNGLRGIELAHSAHPEVILMDINLPGISGLEALALLKADPATARIPVIAVSANALARDVERALQAGFFRHLAKPIRLTELTEVLRLALRAAEVHLPPGPEKRRQ
jgi:CheY-like chemotaxis protein